MAREQNRSGDASAGTWSQGWVWGTSGRSPERGGGPGARLPSPQRALPKPRLLLSGTAPLSPLPSPAQSGMRDPGNQDGEQTTWRLAEGRRPAEGLASTWGRELFFCPTRGLLKAWTAWARGCQGFGLVFGAVVGQRKGSFGQGLCGKWDLEQMASSSFLSQREGSGAQKIGFKALREACEGRRQAAPCCDSGPGPAPMPECLV